MRDAQIIFREILPNALPPVIVYASVVMAVAILLESALAFLNLSDPNVASWGNLIGAGRGVLRTQWYVSAIPGVAILLTVLAVSLVGPGAQRRPQPAPERAAMSAPLLAIEGLTFASRPGADRPSRSRTSRSSFKRQRDPVRRRRERLRQVDDGERRHAASCRRGWTPTAGAILLEGEDLLTLGESEMRSIRGARIGMIFQEPMTALNPLRTIGDQIGEMFRIHTDLGSAEIASAGARPAARRCASPIRRAARAGLSARALGRPAPARDDRHGAGARAAPCSSPTSRRRRST